MNKKISLGAAITFMAVIAAITFSITMIVSLKHFNTKVLNVKSREEMYKKIADMDREVRQNYDGTINEEILMDAISRGYVRGLEDKYSSYLSKSEYEQRLKESSGKLFSIGIDFIKDETGYIKIRKVYEGTPAANEGLLPDDYIISINDTDLKAVASEKISTSLMGEVGSKIKIVYRRDGMDEIKELTRTDIPIPTVEMQMVEANAYIKVTGFTNNTYSEFKQLVNKAISSGATGIIFDVRNNSGGKLETVTSMLDMLVGSGTIATKVDNDGAESVVASSDKYEINLPMAVIINGKSEFAPELFAATLRDFKKASLIGTITAGKGVLQTLIPLTDGSAVNLTTAHIYPPSGAPFNATGILPDYEVKLTSEQELNAYYLTVADDPQILKAIEVVNSSKVQ